MRRKTSIIFCTVLALSIYKMVVSNTQPVAVAKNQSLRFGKTRKIILVLYVLFPIIMLVLSFLSYFNYFIYNNLLVFRNHASFNNFPKSIRPLPCNDFTKNQKGGCLNMVIYADFTVYNQFNDQLKIKLYIKSKILKKISHKDLYLSENNSLNLFTSIPIIKLSNSREKNGTLVYEKTIRNFEKQFFNETDFYFPFNWNITHHLSFKVFYCIEKNGGCIEKILNRKLYYYFRVHTSPVFFVKRKELNRLSNQIISFKIFVRGWYKKMIIFMMLIILWPSINMMTKKELALEFDFLAAIIAFSVIRPVIFIGEMGYGLHLIDFVFGIEIILPVVIYTLRFCIRSNEQYH